MACRQTFHCATTWISPLSACFAQLLRRRVTGVLKIAPQAALWRHIAALPALDKTRRLRET